MKKFFFLLLTVCGIVACTTPEEDAQIRFFWMEQILQLMPQPTAPDFFPPDSLPTMPEDPMDQTSKEPLSPAEDETDPTQGQQPLQEPAAEQAPQTPATTNEGNPQEAAPEGAQAPTAAPAAKPKAPAREETQFMEITLEGAARGIKLQNNAPATDRQSMQRAIERVKQSNLQTLRDIGAMFDDETQAQALGIISKTEEALLRAANTSDSYQNYLNAQQKILQEQDQQLNKVMRANANKIRQIRG